MAVRVLPLAAALALTSLAACQPMYGPPPPHRIVTPVTDEASFRASDFAWSKVAGHNALVGAVTYRAGATRYSCAGTTVVLTPETPWSRRRMGVLYLSTERAALPVADVRSRTAQAPAGDSEPFVKRAACDAQGRFSFAGLPDGSWFVVSIAKPVAGSAPTLALMRHVTTRGGRATAFEL